jgi:bifunctional UDP-N-acetylglucosamine pyrophosphorylase/glucosamine-1-phosphate N-acetyltransferase
VEDEQEILGINDRLQLAQAYTFFQNQIKADWMRAGVTLVDPASITIDDEVQLEADVVIEPQTHLRGKTVIRSGCRIGPSSLVENSQIGRGCTIQFSVVSDSSIHDNSTVGPYAHVRMHSEIADQCRIGNFVEIKKTSMQSHTNAAHLAYLGDAAIGSQVNIGAGTIIANYDGVQKHPTLIGDRSKTGANSVLVAPLQVGQDVTIAAGSTITADLPNDCLAIARAHQVIKPGWRLIRRDGHPSAPMPPAGKPGTMQVRVLRLTPNQDLKEALIQFCRDHAIQAGWILSAVGSLQQATLRFAGAVSPQVLQGHFEIITLAGTLSQEGVHLHSALADQQGTLIAGHLCSNSLIYTTAEIVMGESKDYRFSRELDPATGFAELVIQS